MEWSWPPAFIEEVAERDEGVVAEFVQLGGTGMDEQLRNIALSLIEFPTKFLITGHI